MSMILFPLLSVKCKS